MAESIPSSSKSGFKGSSTFSNSELKQTIDKVQKNAADVFHNTEDFIREYPVRIVLGAAAVGFLAGYIANRNS